LYVKGASEIVLGFCKTSVNDKGVATDLDKSKKEYLTNDVITAMAKDALRTIAIGYCDFTTEDIPDPATLTDDWGYEQKLILQAIVGIIDPLRDDVIDAVQTCQSAGIMVRMVTGDNLETAKAIAKRCGILTEGGIALEGPEFRKMTPADLDVILPKLQVLARSSPDDKHTLVTRLNGKALPRNEEEWKEHHPDNNWETERNLILPGYWQEWSTKYGNDGEVVGVTGDGTNDAPALKAADVGLSMGLSGTDVAKEASDIVILDDKFSSIVKAVLWGRCVYDNIRKFLQFQLTVNVVALCLVFIAACLDGATPLNAIMMLWVNLIMDTMGALALGTEMPKEELLERKPYKRSAPLVSRPMARNILVQSAYQLGVLMLFLLYGPSWLGTNEGDQCVKVSDGLCVQADYTHYSFIFNAFVFCQIFNEFNARSIGDDWKAAFSGLATNPMFLSIIAISIVVQIVFLEAFGSFTKTAGLTLAHWCITIAVGAVSVPLGVLMRFIPVTEDENTFRGYTFVKKEATEEDSKA